MLEESELFELASVISLESELQLTTLSQTASLSNSENACQSSQSSSQLGSRIKTWHYIDSFDNEDKLEDFIFYDKYKTICTHTEDHRTCNVHENVNDHKMLVKAFKCASVNCLREEDDSCAFQYQERLCHQTKHAYLYSISHHSNQYIDIPYINKEFRYGMGAIYKNEILRLLNDNHSIKPSKILQILTKKKIDGHFELDVPLPSLPQVQGIKRRFIQKTDGYGQEWELVENLINSNQYSEELDPNKAFVFGSTLADGSDDDHLRICMTSKALLRHLDSFPEHHRVFHVDGTYKLIKNRFPLIVFGRSDLQGQFHLIAICITSHETADDYAFFFKLISSLFSTLLHSS